MSWLTDLAGKAEDFLVKIDKNAAVAAQTVLTKERITPNPSRRNSGASVASVASIASLASVSSDASGNQVQPSGPATSNSKSNVVTSDVGKLGKPSKLDLDATLMASLNMEMEENSAKSLVNPSLSNGDLSLQHENNLLKQEIKSLSQEIRQSMQLAKQAKTETKNAEQQLKTQAVSLQALEKQLTSLRKENMALADQLLDKDAELSSLQTKVEAIVVEKEHQTKFEELKSQLEAGLKKQQSMELESKIHISKIEKERDNYLAEYQQQQQQLSSVKEELAMTHQSFNEYKLRAQRILQDKDRLLQDIKEHQTVEGLQPSEFLMAELNQLQQERDLLREETAQANSQLQQCRKEISQIEAKYDEEIRQLREINASTESRLAEERSKKELVDSELKQLYEEMRYVREDMSQQKIQSAGRIHQLETDLVKLRTQLTSKQNNSTSPSQEELEQRLRTLTETLVAKQAVLETVQSERSSLLLQLERANQTRSNGGTPTEDNSTRVLLNITDDELAKVTTGVSRRMRRAYTTLDSLNFRVGQALRRRPAARLVLFFYMVVLHFWVAFVLLTYTPEMHESDRSLP